VVYKSFIYRFVLFQLTILSGVGMGVVAFLHTLGVGDVQVLPSPSLGDIHK
jgi:hypothetical protein